jgi:hypothetical protein
MSRCLLPFHLSTETDLVSETSCFYSIKHRTVEKVQKPSNFVSSVQLGTNFLKTEVTAVSVRRRIILSSHPFAEITNTRQPVEKKLNFLLACLNTGFFPYFAV